MECLTWKQRKKQKGLWVFIVTLNSWTNIPFRKNRKLSCKVNLVLLGAGCSACSRQTYSLLNSWTIKSFPLFRHKKTHMTIISRALEKWEESSDHCEGMTIIVSFRDWYPQVRVIMEGHYSPSSVGVCLYAAEAGLSGGSQQQITKVWLPRDIQMWQIKDKSVDQQRVPQPHSATLPSIWQMAWACLRPWRWGVQWLQRPSVICRNITGWEKVSVSQIPTLLRGRERR